jgi:S1-C subfamily serine protease
MTQPAMNLSELSAAAAAAAEQSLVHVAAHCRRGATGSVFGDEGVVLTTARAVAGRERLEISLGDSHVSASVVGFDAATDIGVLRPEAPIGKAPRWADAPARLGSLLLSTSRPGRALRVRLGVVSRVGDAFRTLRGGRVERYVETDVTPEPGFSGGLGFDLEGRALGMSSAGLFRGVPLLIDKQTLDRVVAEVLSHGRVRRGYLGVGTQRVRLPDASAAIAGQPVALLVASVQPGSAAEAAGVSIGDVLLSLGVDALTDTGALQAALEDAAGRTLPLALLRAGQKLVLDVTPGERS